MFFFNYLKFLIMILISIFVCLTSSNLISMWISLEINFYAFLPMLIEKKMFQYEKSLMMYFWTQSIASNVFLFVILSLKTVSTSNLSVTFLIITLIFKMGMFPFHMWILAMVEKMSWFLTAFILSIQKFLPIMIMSMIFYKSNLNLLILMNTMFSSLSGMKTFSLRKIFVFSSINHLSIMMFSMMYSKKSTFLYLLLYTIMNFSLSKIFSSMKTNMMTQLYLSFKEFMKSLSVILMVAAMMGLPPFLGFIPKTMVFIYMMEQNEFFFLSMFLILNTLSTYFYMRMIMCNIILSIGKEKNKTNTSYNFNLIMGFSFLSNFLIMS